MPKHTPGPWRFGTLREIGGRAITCIYADTPDSPGGKTIVIRTGTEKQVNRANINLATAAPELLEALVAVTEAYERLLSDKGYDADTIASGKAGKARAAIAKATAE